jgi:hypothetical protein
VLEPLSAVLPEDRTKEIQPVNNMKVPSGNKGKQSNEI